MHVHPDNDPMNQPLSNKTAAGSPSSLPPQTDQSCRELREDLSGLLALAAEQRNRIEALREKLHQHSRHIPVASKDAIAPVIEYLQAGYAELRIALRAALQAKDSSPQILTSLMQKKREALLRLRSLQGIAGALLAGVEWQSPSFLHATWSQAGTRTGLIIGMQNDYTREFHAAASDYEEAFLKDCIDRRHVVYAYATASGMAAFSTAVAYLQHVGMAEGAILAGECCFHQCKIILNNAFRERIHYLPEHDTDGFLNAVRRHRPAVIFLDSFCNSESIAMPDLASLLPAIAAMVDRSTTVVLNNTGMATLYQPLADLPAQTDLQLVVVESLNKFHQFGYDRVTGGILWTAGSAIGAGLFKARMHLGTNIQDASVHALPMPDRQRLEKRMLRIGRNTHLLAQQLQTYIEAHSSSPFSHVAYPGLAAHPAHAWASRRKFYGASFALVSHARDKEEDFYLRFITCAVDEARKANVDLVAGPGFGFDTTRVYLAALFSDSAARPFLRISAGTESLEEAERLGEVLVRAVERVSRLGAM